MRTIWGQEENVVKGMSISRSVDRIEKGASTVELLARHGPVEVTRCRIAPGKHFYLDAQDEWAGFEFIYVLAGELILNDGKERIALHPGDYLHHRGLPKRAYFQAETEADFLMVSSPPSYHLVRKEIQALMALARSVEEKDAATEGHCKRLERLAVATGERLGLADQRLIDLSYAAYLHDVGKVKVPAEILNKAEPLTEEEWKEMRRHPEYGEEMLKEKEFLRAAARIVRAHHERYDGRGYPDGLKGEQIPLEARIIAVVDAYDAITSERPYQPALAKKKAFDELKKGAGSQFDERVVKAFIALAGGDE